MGKPVRSFQEPRTVGHPQCGASLHSEEAKKFVSSGGVFVRWKSCCFWVNFPGEWGVCRFVRIGMKRKLGKKKLSQSTAEILEAFGFVIESKQLEVWKCRPFLKQNGSMECRFYVICVFFARSLRKNVYYVHMYILEDSIILIGS